MGRKRVYGYEVLILAAAAIACAFSPNIWWLIAFRFILGIGIGGDYPVSSTIMSEYAGRSSRGLMVSLVFAAQAAGLIVGPLIAAGLLVSGVSHDLAWRLVLGFGAIPGLAVFYLRRQIQETPRFTMESGHHEEFSRAAGNILGQHNQPGSVGDPSKRGERPSFVEGFALLVSSRRRCGARARRACRQRERHTAYESHRALMERRDIAGGREPCMTAFLSRLMVRPCPSRCSRM